MSPKVSRIPFEKEIFPDTVEPRPVDTPLLWTPHHCGHFSPGPFGFPYIFHVFAVHSVSFTTVDTSLLWTLFGRPSGVHISEVLLYTFLSPHIYVPLFSPSQGCKLSLEQDPPTDAECGALSWLSTA